MCHRAQKILDADPMSVAEARHWAIAEVKSRYGGFDASTSKIELLVSELVTNSVKANAHHLDLSIESHHHLVHIAVNDDAPGLPVLRHPTFAAASGGRGLTIIEALSLRWGVDVGNGEKSVWCDVAVPEEATPGFDCTLCGT